MKFSDEQAMMDAIESMNVSNITLNQAQARSGGVMEAILAPMEVVVHHMEIMEVMVAGERLDGGYGGSGRAGGYNDANGGGNGGYGGNNHNGGYGGNNHNGGYGGGNNRYSSGGSDKSFSFTILHL